MSALPAAFHDICPRVTETYSPGPQPRPFLAIKKNLLCALLAYHSPLRRRLYRDLLTNTGEYKIREGKLEVNR